MLLTYPPSSKMPHHLSQHANWTTVASPGRGETSGEDNNFDEPVARDRLERVHTPPSPSNSLSTTVSELEIEHGDAFLRVKRLKMEEDLDDSLSTPEVISSDKDEEPVPKKRKMSARGAKPKGKKTAGGMIHTYKCLLTKRLAGKAVANSDWRTSEGKGRKRKKSGMYGCSDRTGLT